MNQCLVGEAVEDNFVNASTSNSDNLPGQGDGGGFECSLFVRPSVSLSSIGGRRDARRDGSRRPFKRSPGSRLTGSSRCSLTLKLMGSRQVPLN